MLITVRVNVPAPQSMKKRENAVMRMYDIIRKKRDGNALSKEEIRFFIEGITNGEIPDYQASALCMAIYFQGMNEEEIAELTFAIRDSGERLDFSAIPGIRADKHSTGGVGDKTSMVVVPMVASFGIRVAKISGRGLGHTGGTVDKLESIPGFRTDLSEAEFTDCVNRVGAAIIGQSKEVAPADKKLYALRDVTATVDSTPLIVSSIMGKKLAADDDVIVLDVKCGSGSFMKTPEDAKRLAEMMVNIGKRAGKKICALITDMDRPLGIAVGNASEVREAVETLQGGGPNDFRELCVILTAEILKLSGKGNREECLEMAEQSLHDGSAYAVFREMVRAQGGDARAVEDPSLLGESIYDCEIRAEQDGYIAKMNTESIGIASLLLGAGRNRQEDQIDYNAGIRILKKTGDFVKRGDLLAVLYADREALFEAASETYKSALSFSVEAPLSEPLVLGRVE